MDARLTCIQLLLTQVLVLQLLLCWPSLVPLRRCRAQRPIRRIPSPDRRIARRRVRAASTTAATSSSRWYPLWPNHDRRSAVLTGRSAAGLRATTRLRLRRRPCRLPGLRKDVPFR